MHTNKSLESLGYTLIEAIMVLVVVGILSTTVFARTDAVTKRDVTNQADQLRRNLTHVQSIAITYGVALRLNVSTNNYTITCLTVGTQCASVGAFVTDPATGQDFKVNLPSAMTLTAVNSSNQTANTIDFDSAGRPTQSASPSATNPVRTFTLASAGKTSTVILRPVTGFVEVSY